MLNFWATWCPPCRAETPDMNAAYRKLHAPDVAFLGIDTTETAPIVKTFLSAKGVPYPTALAGPDLYNAFGIAYIPTTIVLDAHGIVRARWVGGVEPAQLAGYIAAARAGRNAMLRLTRAGAARCAARRRRTTRSAARPTNATRRSRRCSARSRRPTQPKMRTRAAVDDERTQREEGALRIAAGSAVRDAATTPAQRAAGLALFAQGNGDQNRWSRCGASRSRRARTHARTIRHSSRRSRAPTTVCTTIPT